MAGLNYFTKEYDTCFHERQSGYGIHTICDNDDTFLGTAWLCLDCGWWIPSTYRIRLKQKL